MNPALRGDHDLYATLGVPPSASEDDIKRAFRRLSRTYHPDRRLDTEEKQAAEPHWLKISAAYDVLANDRKRMVYDELGSQHLVDGLALLKTRQGRKVKTAEELHREWRRARSRDEEQHAMGRMGASGAMVISASLSELAQPSDPSVPFWRRLKPELSSVAMQEEMRLSLDAKNTLTVANHAITKAGLGGSTLRVGFGRALSRRSSLQLTSSLSHEPYALDVAATRQLSTHSSGTASFNLAARGVAGLTFNVSRQLTRHLLGGLSLALPLLSFRGEVGADESSLRLYVHRSPSGGNAREGEGEGGEEGEEEAGAEAGAETGAAAGGDAAGRAADDASAPPASTPPAPLPSHPSASSSILLVEAGPSLSLRLGARRMLRRRASRCLVAARRLASRLVAWVSAVRVALMRPAVLGRQLERALKQRLGHTGGELALQPSGLRYGTSVVWRHSARSRTKLAASLGLGSFSLTLSTERSLSLTSASTVGIGVSLSQRGLVTKLRLERHGHRLNLPIFLASSPSPRELAQCLSLPAALVAFSRTALVNPLRLRRRVKEARQAKKEAETLRMAAAIERKSRAAEARLLEKDAAQRAREEAERANGLVILAAAYGDVAAFLAHHTAASGDGGGGAASAGASNATVGDDGWWSVAASGEGAVSGEGGASGEGLVACWLDVRIPLQYAVADSTLTLPASSKASVRGFSPPPAHAAVAAAAAAADCAPTPAAASLPSLPGAGGGGAVGEAAPQRTTSEQNRKGCRLWVRYRVGNEVRTVEVADDEPLHLGYGA